MSASLSDYLRLVRFSHSIFALPFALQGAWLAAGGVPGLRDLGLILVCAVAARTAAMGFNRLADRGLDAHNPRTSGRELPAGILSAGGVAGMVLAASVLFVLGAFLLGPLCGWLSLPVLAVLLGYSYAKRFTWLAHGILGLALGLAPLGAWLAISKTLDGPLVTPLLLAGAVLTWVAGFDLIYSCQDAEHDAREGLRSVPARFGVPAALTASRVLHAATTALLLGVGLSAGLGWIYWATVALAAALLVWEHGLVGPDDLSRVGLAFFTLNGWVGVGLFLGVALDLGLLGHGQ